jgi:hypothetical protein
VVDDIGWPQDIGALAVLGGSKLIDADGRLRIEKVRATRSDRLHLVPRFRRCSTVRGAAWAGRCGSTPPASTLPNMSESARLRPR